MGSLVLIDGDVAMFNPAFNPAMVQVKPGIIRASGKEDVGGKKICVDGDEKSVEVPGCLYVTPVYSIAGVGTLRIRALVGDGKSVEDRIDGKAILIKGSGFIAVFQVTQAAMMPPPGPGMPIPDATREYVGNGNFETTNTKRMAR